MEDDELADRLEDFGLSEKEAVTYLTILRHGEAKASTIADDAGVSKRYVYSISEELEERGFVEVKDHVVPTMIRAFPPEEVMDTLTETLSRIRPELEGRYTTTTQQLDQFEVVKSRVTVIKRLEQLLADANEEVTISVPWSMLSEIRDRLAETLDRNVLVMLVVTGVEPDDLDDPDDEFGDVASVARVWSEPMPMMVTVDTRFGLVAPNDMVARTNSDMRAIALAQEQLVPILVGSFLGNYWPMAEQAYTSDPGELPERFTGFRRAVLEAELHRRAGTDLVATVDARPVHEEGDYREVTGHVLEVRQSLLAPANNAFPVENALVLETDDGTKSVGGEGAFVEDLEARDVVLDRVEE